MLVKVLKPRFQSYIPKLRGKLKQRKFDKLMRSKTQFFLNEPDTNFEQRYI